MTTSATTAHTMDVLAAMFFMIAGAWLLVALLYSCLVLLFLRLRAQGRLGSIYDDDFGRVHFCDNRCYIPLGCIFRRYIRHLEHQPRNHQLRLMTREERKRAMEVLLLGSSISGAVRSGTNRKRQPDGVSSSPSSSKEMVVETIVVQDDHEPDHTTNYSCDIDVEAANHRALVVGDDQESCQGPVCSICLGEYDDSDDGMSGPAFQSKTCVHQFHQHCIIDWLKRQANTDCPCCRVSMVKEDDVWDTVQQIRKERRKQILRDRRMRQRQENTKCTDCQEGTNSNNEPTRVETTEQTLSGDIDLQP